MNFAELEIPYKECLGAFEGLRQLGFKPEDIFFMANTTPSPPGQGMVQVGLELHAQGKEFIITTGFLPGSREQVCRKWALIAEALNATKRNTTASSQLDTIWRESMASRDFVGLGSALVMKGFMLPKLGN